jgi:hypothetical protein
MMRQFLAVVFAVIAAGLLLSTGWAQSTSPTVPVKLQIIDQAGAPIAGACLHIAGANRDFERTMGADQGGRIVAILPMGGYEVTAVSQGFNKAVKHVDVEKSPAELVTLRLAVGVGSGTAVSAAPLLRLEIGPGLPQIQRPKSDPHHESCTGCDCYFRGQ